MDPIGPRVGRGDAVGQHLEDPLAQLPAGCARDRERHVAAERGGVLLELRPARRGLAVALGLSEEQALDEPGVVDRDRHVEGAARLARDGGDGLPALLLVRGRRPRAAGAHLLEHGREVLRRCRVEHHLREALAGPLDGHRLLGVDRVEQPLRLLADGRTRQDHGLGDGRRRRGIRGGRRARGRQGGHGGDREGDRGARAKGWTGRSERGRRHASIRQERGRPGVPQEGESSGRPRGSRRTRV